MKIKIVSDGTVGHTRVFHAETGEELENVRKAHWWAIGGENTAEVMLEIFGVPVEIEGKCNNATCARLGETGCHIIGGADDTG